MLKNCVRICAAVIFSLFLILATLGAGCAESSENDTRERTKIKAVWLKSAKEVVRKINDKEVAEIFQFIEKNAILAAPNKQGVQFIEAGKSKNWLSIVPLLKKDKNISEQWKNIFSASTAAHFLSGARAIVIKNYIPCSPTGKAIIFLHEGYHAYTFVKNPYKGEQSDKEYFYEEARAHTFQNKIMSLLGGKKYKKILDKEIARITAQVKKDGGKIGNKIANRAKYNEELAGALGQPVSGFEKDLIQTSVWIHAVFVSLDNNFKGDILNQKALFLRDLYKKVGVRR